MSNESNINRSAFELSTPLSEWICSFKTKIFGKQQRQPSGGDLAAITTLPDDYLLSALQIAASLADQICKAEEGSDCQSLMPSPGAEDWINSIVVITDEDRARSPSSDAHGHVSNNIRAEIVPSLLFNATDGNDSGQERNKGIIYSLGIVIHELFSMGERPAEVEPKQIVGDRTDALGPQIQTGTTNELLESLDLDPLPFDRGDGTIDLEALSGVDINGSDLLAIDDLHSNDPLAIDDLHGDDPLAMDDLQDEYNDLWGNDDIDGSLPLHLHGQNPRKKESASNKSIMYAMSVETLKDKGVPISVCDLISNMLDVADDRHEGEDAYRSMSDVRDDLQLMLDKPSIYLYDQDMGSLSTTQLKFDGTLYGRKAELSTIIDAYRRSAVGESESVVISGKSGTGKSFLAVEVGKYVISNRGIFLTGKFDQLQQGKPFSALASAFNHFCDYLARDHTLASMKQKLVHQVRRILGRDAYYLTKLIPTLAILLGLEGIGCNHDEDNVNAQKRLQVVLCHFVQVISNSFAAPVTLFLDDLQWADSASIAAVNQLLLGGVLNSQHAHFFFLGCYREGDVDGGVNDDVIPSTKVKLDSIDEEALGAMVSETLCLLPRLTRTLSRIIYHKTKGNPLFVIRLMISLNKDGLLRPSLRRRRWEWDEEKIISQKLSDDMAEFLSQTILALPNHVKSTLSTLSCFGSSVNSAFVETLERVLDKNLRDGIETAIAEGLLDKIDDQYRFSHDRIQEAAYNMMNCLDRCRFHFSYGMALAPKHDEEDGFLFTAVSQLNLAGPEAVEDERQYASVANLNLRAGKKAMEMSDFEAAYSYFDNGITFLRKKHWEDHYTLSLELFNLAANCALANGDTTSLKLLSQQVVKKAQSFEDTLNVTYFITCSLAWSSGLPESIEEGLDVLSQLGIDLQGCGSSMEACVNETKDLLSAYTNDDLLNTRRMTNSTMTMAMKFLSKLMVGMALTKPESAPYVAKQIIELSVDHGMNPVSSLGFAHFGSYAAKLGDISGGYNYVKLACSLLDKLGSRENAGEVICIRTQVLSYIEPLQATLEYHNEGCAAAIASGDIIQAALNLCAGSLCNFYAGVKLQTTREKGDEVINFLQERKMVIFLLEIQLVQNSVLKLIGIDEEPKQSSTEEESIVATMNSSVKLTHFFHKSYISFMYRLYDDTKDYAEKFLDCVTSSAYANLTISQSLIAFYVGLISFWVARNSRDGGKWHERGNKSKLALKKWAETSQWTFENKWYLLEAEEAFSNSNFDDAKMYYEKAVSSAKAHKFVHEEALACELAAYFYLDIGEVNIAADYCLLAHERYQEWGAIGKCTSLIKFFGSSIMNNCVGSSSAISAGDQFDLAQEQSVAEFEEEEETRNAYVYAAGPVAIARIDPFQSDGDRSGEESSVSVGGGNENDEEVYVDVDRNNDEEEGLKPKQVSTETADHGSRSSQENDDDMPDIEDDVNGSGAVQSNKQEDEGRNQIVAGNRAMLSEMEDLREELYSKGQSEAKLKVKVKSNDLRATQNEVHRLSNEINDPRAEAGAYSKTCADVDSDQDELRRLRDEIEKKNREITRLRHELHTTATAAQESTPDYIIEAGNICVDRVAFGDEDEGKKKVLLEVFESLSNRDKMAMGLARRWTEDGKTAEQVVDGLVNIQMKRIENREEGMNMGLVT